MAQKCVGSACNSVVTVASLGATTFFSGRVGNAGDHYELKHRLEKKGNETIFGTLKT